MKRLWRAIKEMLSMFFWIYVGFIGVVLFVIVLLGNRLVYGKKFDKNSDKWLI